MKRIFKFHGAFGSKRKAVKKERAAKGRFILKRKIRGISRWIVVSKKSR